VIARPNVLAPLALALAGCSFWGEAEDKCASVEEYQDAKIASEISIPAGLDRPDPTGKLVVPAGPEPVQPLSKNAACLQWPPDYFDKPLTKSEPGN
jgi:uncharacterized lipoprotein